MKKILLPLLIVTLFSCSRDNTSLRTQGEPELSYDLAGTHYKHTGEATTANALYGVGVFKIAANPATTTLYRISGITNAGNSIYIILVTDSLKEITYHVPQGANALIITGGDSHGLFQNAEYIDVIIDSYKNGIVNGRFSGNISKIIPLPLGNLDYQAETLSNGIIKNAKVTFF